MNKTPHCLLALAFIPMVTSAFELAEETATLRGKSENVQQTPYSITVLEADEIEESVRWDLADLEGLAPGFIIDPMAATPNGAAMSLRGISSSEASPGFFPAVALTIDGVYQGTHASQNPPLFDFERVEITRGPNGGTSGIPAVAGTIDVVRNKPSGEREALARLTLGDQNRRRLDAMANLPVNERIAARLRLSLRDARDIVRDQSPESVISQRDDQAEEIFSASAAVSWQYLDNLAIRYTYDLTHDDSNVPARANMSTSADLVCDPSAANSCSFDGDGILPEAGSFTGTTQNFSNHRSYDVDQHAFHVQLDTADYTLRSITAWRDTTETSHHDLDGSFLDIYSNISSIDYDQFTQDVAVMGAYSDRANYTAGLFYLNSEYRTASEDLYILPALDTAGRIIDVADDATRNLTARQRTSLISFFLTADYAASDQWTLDASLRWTNVDREFDETVSRVSTIPSPPSMLVGSVSSAEAIGSLGARFAIDDNSMAYLRYSRDFRPAGHDDTANSADGASPFGEESVDGVEIGFKTEMWNDRLRLNYVGYQNTWRDKLERFATPVASGRIEAVLKNLSRVEVRGHELEIEAVPIDPLKLRAILTHQSSDYLDYTIPDLAGGADPISRSDLIPAYAPSDIFQFSGIYTHPYANGLLRFFASYRFTKSYTSQPIVPSAAVDNFSMIDLSVDYQLGDWTFRIFSRNTNNQRFITNVNRPLDASLASLPPTITSTLGIATTADFNDPEFTGLQVIYTPSF